MSPFRCSIAKTLLGAFFAVVIASSASAQERRLLIFDDADISGFDYDVEKDVSLDQCRDACLEDSACKAFTFNTAAARCFKKTDPGTLTTFAGAVSGRVVEGAAAPELAPELDLSFLPAGLVKDAKAYARTIAKIENTDTRGELLRQGAAAIAAGDMRAARGAYAAVLAKDMNNTRAWTKLGWVLLSIKPENYNERYRLPEAATSALLNGLPLVRRATDRAYGLRLLASALERRQLWRAAMGALDASLAAHDDDKARADLLRLRQTHGFRMLDYSVDANAASPRACVQFSEDLVAKGTDYADFVTLDGAPAPAITRQMRQICVDGLAHGTRYRITLRQGLPSAMGEVLEKPVELTVYVRDRAPALRFTGSNYVLPRTGAKGIPIVTINTELVTLQITRIGERAMAQVIRNGRFLSQLNSYRAGEIAKTSGQKVWQGEMPVKSKLNAEVVTAFPIDEVLPNPEPGVYVMTARPDRNGPDDWEDQPTQWFIVTDIGLASLAAEDGMHVFARSLATAEPLGGAQLTLIARNNEILGSATSDASGYVRFAPGLARGSDGLEPALIVASLAGGDFAFLDLTDPAFDLSDRGVAGRPAPGPLDVFMVPERGVYRPGETVHLLALMRDDKAMAVTGVPLIFVITRPDGVEYARQRVKSAGVGGHEYNLDLGETVTTGTWTARVYADPKAPSLAEVRFLVEDFVPERLDFTIESPARLAVSGSEIDLAVEGRYLFGAPAADLRLEGEISIAAARDAPAGFAGYSFGLADEEVSATRTPLENLPPTGSDGKAAITVAVPPLPEATGRLQARISLRLAEPGGRAITRSLTLPVAGAGPLIGIKPSFADGQVPEGAMAGFYVRAMGADGLPAALGGASWQLLKLDRRYQWYRLDGSWAYEPITRTRRVADGRLDLGSTGAARISAKVDWGRYRLEITGDGADGPVSSVEFDAGWYVADASTETPDTLEVSLDKATYRPGETARLRLSSRYAGKALITVTAGRLIEMRTVDVPKTGAIVDLEVGEDWGAGAYVTAALYRPMDVDAGRNPARGLGLDWLAVDNSDRTLGVNFVTPDIARPGAPLVLPLTITGLKAGEAARVTVAAVDVGILNLTGYEPPRPSEWYFGQRRLGAEMRDLYGKLINGLQGIRGAIRSGGDGPGLSMTGAPETEKPVSLFSGIVAVGANGSAEVTFELPPFNGTLRLMAMAWSASAVGQGTADLIVRDPVVLTSSLPRFLAPGDSSRLRLDISNLDGPPGEWTLEVQTSGPVAAGDRGQGSFVLDRGGRYAAEIPIAANGAGEAVVTAWLTHADGMEIVRSWDLPVRAAQPPVTRRNLQTLAGNGGQLTLSADLAAEFVAGTSKVSLTVSRGLFTDLPGLLTALDRYPYGCAEQTVSRAMPLLYANQVASEAGLGDDDALRGKVQKAIARVLQYQGSNGSFGLWGPGGNDLWLDAYVTDFLGRARAQGYSVPGTAFSEALDRLENGIAYINDIDGGQNIAYALYVLARNARASIGDLRYYVETRLDEFKSPLAKAQLGGALAQMGDRKRAAIALRAAFAALAEPGDRHTARSDYGSRLRDGAALLTIAAEAKTDIAIPPIVRFVENIRAKAGYTSTQENAWMLLAAYGLMGADDDLRLTIDGADHRGRLTRVFTGESLGEAPVVIKNTSAQALRSIVTVTGVPQTPEPPRADGLTLTRQYFALDGTPIYPATVAQNERLVVVLNLTEENDWPSRLIVADYLPAGFEIENPRLVGGEDAGAFEWVGEVSRPSHTEFRDDRFVASFEEPGGDAGHRVAYLVRVVSTGDFAHPPAVAEDMYRPGIEARTALGRVEVVGPRPR
ncbi:PAN domain protein [hydrothermal vent metagenome]|uniref:PAN domain protein n=1 Tax=hydrothermal vent metagenome TaxID=652676 RepID=A0A3B0T4U7_9ZZZZ